MKNKRGFTLTEVLAVVVILSILSLIIIASINGYIEHGKEEYNGALKKELLAAGETFFNNNTDLLPTDNYIKQNQKTYNFVTAAELASDGQISKDFVDAEKRECNSQSFVYVGGKTQNGEYEWHPCLICTEQNSDGKNVINYSYNAEDNTGDPICAGYNWKEDITPRCEVDEDKLLGSGVSNIDNSVKTIIFSRAEVQDPGTAINCAADAQRCVKTCASENVNCVSTSVEGFENPENTLKKESLTRLLENLAESKNISPYGTWKVELVNQLDTGDCGSIELSTNITCPVSWKSYNGISGGVISGGSRVKYIYFNPVTEENADGSQIKTFEPKDFSGNTIVEKINNIIAGASIATGKYQVSIGSGEQDSDDYNVSCGEANIDKTAPTCNISFLKAGNAVDASNYRKYTMTVTGSDSGDVRTDSSELQICDGSGCAPGTKLSADGSYAYTTQLTKGTVKTVRIKDKAGNIGECTGTVPTKRADEPECEFANDPNKNKWLKGGEKRTLYINCLVPAGYSRGAAASYLSLVNKYGTLAVSNAGTVNTTTRKVTVTLTYTAYAHGTKAVSGQYNDTAKLAAGYVYKDSIKSNADSITPLKVDNTGPSISASASEGKTSGYYKAPVTFTFSCSDKGSGVNTFKVNGTAHSSPYKVTRKSAGNPVSYKVYCSDKAGNSNDKTYKYYVKVHSSSSKCSCSAYNYTSYCAAYKTKKECKTTKTTKKHYYDPYFQKGKCPCTRGSGCTCRNRHEGGSWMHTCTNCWYKKTTSKTTCKTVKTNTCKTWASKRGSCKSYSSCWHY